MRIFVTGATGFIGSKLVPELLQAGHQVLGLTRSQSGADALRNAGAEVQHGNVEDLDSLRKGAANADGIVHLAFNHDFSQFLKVCEDDRKAIAAMGEVLVGSDRPFVITSGTAVASSADGKPVTENSPLSTHNPRSASEVEVQKFTQRGVNTSIMRLSQVHDTHKQGLVTYVAAVARQKGASAYIGDGSNPWSAVHVSDAVRLYRLAVEKAQPGAIYHSVAEQAVSMKSIAQALANGLKVPAVSIKPEQAEAHFGWLTMFVGLDLSASSALTQQQLKWSPTGPGLIADLNKMDYTHA
jgi:nucleoside-diphosphate-sugar epimerase